MASKSVSPVDIKIKVTGAEQLASLKSSFRDLGKQTKLSDKDIVQATKDIVKFAKEVGNSEATIKGQIKALEGLRSQAVMGGKAFVGLGTGIQSLKASLRGATIQTELQAQSFSRLGKSSGASVEQIRRAIEGLKRLRNETRLDSEAFVSFGKDVAELTQKLRKAEEQTESLTQARKRSSQGLGSGSGALGQRIRDSKLLVDQLRSEQQVIEASTASKAKFGALSLLDKGVKSKGNKTFEEAVAGAALGMDVKKILTPADYKAALDESQRLIADYQKQIEKRLKEGIGASFQQAARSARESSRAMAAAFADPEILNALSNIDKRLGILPKTAAGYSQRLKELGEQLANTTIASDQYVAVALRIARVQREATVTAQGLGAALVKDLASGNTVKNQKNLREAIGQLQAEMNELNTETAEGSSKYAENARQVNNLQKELDEIAGSYRNVTDMARQASTAQGVYANTSVGSNYLRRGIVRQQEAARAELGAAVRAGVASTQLALPAAGQTTAPGTGRERSGRAEPLIPESRRGFAQESLGGARLQGPGLYRPEPALPPGFAAGMSEPIKKQANALREAATAYKPYNAEIRKANAANNGSISGINNLRAALERKRNELPTTSAAFKRLTQQIERLDRQSEKASRGMSRRKFSPGKAAQVAGATISGGIFGGPEGFLGGAIGGAVGGVGGSFAGAALGAQVGQLRQTLGGFADYAASITRLKIALEGITEVQGDAIASQGNYARAVAAAASVTKELNVPQEIAIKGITRLTAAVKGAGGGVADAELAFKNITAAITATGGGAEQVEGAVTALVQIFSKGKVSAEEINQIAERLPGTFNKIAEASGRTGPELTKALQSGEVGLNDLMKFLVQLGGDYEELAKKIAGSSESAGARLTVAYNKMRIEIGKALQPVGAEFQEAFLEFITDIGPALVETAKAVGEGLRFIIQNRNAIGTLASFAAKLVAVNFALKAFATLNGPLRLMFALIRTGFKQTTQQASLAATKLGIFATTVKALAASLVAPIVITFAIVGAELVISYFNRIKQAKADLDASGTKPQGEVFFRSIGGTAATKETLRSNFKDITKNMELLRQRIKKSEEKLAKARETRGVDPAVNPGAGMAPVAGFALPEREDVTTRLAADKAELARLKLNYKTLIDKYPDAPDAVNPLTVFDDTTGTDGGGKGKADQTLSRLIGLQNEYDSIIRSSPLLEIQRFQIANSLALVRAQEDNNAELINTIKNNEINLDFAAQELRIRNQYIDAMNAANSIENPQERLLKERIAKQKQAFELEKLIVAANGKKLALTQDTAIAAEKIAKASEDELFNLRGQLGFVGKQERIDRYRQSRKDAGDPNAEQQADLFRQTIDPTLLEGLGQNIRRLKEELEELVNPINQITSSAEAIGTAFSKSFTDAITGATTAKQALANFFRSVGSFFIDMAGQIIAKMITMAILNKIVGVLPGSGGFNAASTLLGAGGGSVGGIGTLGPNFGFPAAANGAYFDKGVAEFARGGIFAENKIVPYAKGGIVNKPTMFAYANGGTGRFGLMGEAGPEAIMPLRRGSNGRLGVESSGASVGDINVNVDASGSSVEGEAEKSNKLGKAIGFAVQQELVKQKRPGGLLHSSV